MAVGAVLGMLGKLMGTSSEQSLSSQVDCEEEKEEGVSFVEKVSFSGPLVCLSRELT